MNNCFNIFNVVLKEEIRFEFSFFLFVIHLEQLILYDEKLTLLYTVLKIQKM